MSEYRVEMKIKRKTSNHLEMVDTFNGTSEQAINYLADKYVGTGWLQRFENRFLEGLKEYEEMRTRKKSLLR